jgi:two-component system LytT family response regulator
MKKVLLIDDEPLARSIVREFLKAHQSTLEIVGECANGFEGLKAIEQHAPDLIFLDIQMPKINGFEMLELVDSLPGVIFTTAFDEFAIRAFEANAVDYLLKPFTQERFDQAIEKWKIRAVSSHHLQEITRKQPEENQRIVIKDGQEIRIIPLKDVLCVEAYDDYVKVHTASKYYLKKQTMSFYEEALAPLDILRVHRSFLLNLQHLTRLESFEKNSYQATLSNGMKVPVSRSNYSRLKSALGI